MKKSDLGQWIRGDFEPLDTSMAEGLSEGNETSKDPFAQSHRTEKAVYRRLHKWNHSAGEHYLHVLYIVLAVLLCAALCGIMIYACMDLPSFGKADSLIDTELSEFYVEEGLEHTGAPNIVTGIIMEFRGFDTLGESHVLFIAVTMVILLLYTPAASKAINNADTVNVRHYEPTHDEVLKHSARMLLPVIIVFGVYILLNGHISPGGGFSGGAVIGAGLMLVLEAFGPAEMSKYLTFKVLRRMMTCALVFYACSKCYIFFTGANGIENGLSTGVFGRILSGGLLMPINLAVGTVVACTMYTMYALFRRKGEV